MYSVSYMLSLSLCSYRDISVVVKHLCMHVFMYVVEIDVSSQVLVVRQLRPRNGLINPFIHI